MRDRRFVWAVISQHCRPLPYPMYANPLLLVTNPPVFVTLFTGLLLAFAVQLLLTTLGIAAGVTALGYLPNASSEPVEPQEPEATDRSSTVNKIGIAIGAGTLLTVNTVLFTACFLAVKLSLVSSIPLGAVLGVVIWSGYFLVVLWLSSKAAGSVLGILFGAVSAGVQGLIATATNALGWNKQAQALPEALKQRVATTEASLATVEASLATVQTQLDTHQLDVKTTLRDYLQTVQPPKPDLPSIRQEVAAVLASAGLSSVAKSATKEAAFSQLDRQALVELVSHRTDFSRRDVNEVVEQLEGAWHEVISAPEPIADLTTFFEFASPDNLTAATVNDRLKQLLATAQSHEGIDRPANQANLSSLEPKRLLKRLMQTVRDRVDLSDIDVSSLLQQLQAFTSSAATPEGEERLDAFNSTIRSDVEAYLLNAYPWNLTRKTVQAEFKDVLYDPEANPTAVRQQLLTLDRDFFMTLLEQRDDLATAKLHKIVDRLQETQQTVLKSLDVAIAEAPSQAFSAELAAYLQSAQPAYLKPANLQRQLQTILQKAEATVDQWSDRLRYLSRDRVMAMLSQRQDLKPQKVEEITTQLETVRDRLLAETQARQAEAKAEAEALWQTLGEYVSDRSQKLNARNIQRQLKRFTKVAKTELASLQMHLPSFDCATAEQWLHNRQDLSEKQRKRVLHQLEKTWNSICDVPASTQNDVETNANQLLKLLTEYVQQLDAATFSMADLPQDLFHYFQQRHISLDLLSQLPADWQPLIDAIQRRQDLTRAQQHQLLQHLQRSLYTIGKFPRRLALRSKRQMQSWQDHLSDYLRHAEREDLSIDRIPQLLQRLLDSAQATSGIANWLEALQHQSTWSRDGLVALLSERGDLTETDTNQIVEQVETTMQQAIAQAQALQQQAQDAIASTLDKLRHYITSLPLPDLDYDRFKHDLQQVLVDPRAGLENLSSALGETLRDQLSSLNRETLTTLISTRDDLSETFAQQITERIDTVRLGAIAQIEAMQQASQQRLEALKQQAQRQAEETRKTVAIAAWWLFATALSSALTSAIAGALAIGGIEWVEQIAGW